jgi:hypothetical protein
MEQLLFALECIRCTSFWSRARATSQKVSYSGHIYLECKRYHRPLRGNQTCTSRLGLTRLHSSFKESKEVALHLIHWMDGWMDGWIKARCTVYLVITFSWEDGATIYNQQSAVAMALRRTARVFVQDHHGNTVGASFHQGDMLMLLRE